jgi:hypothetical protein
MCAPEIRADTRVYPYLPILIFNLQSTRTPSRLAPHNLA